MREREQRKKLRKSSESGGYKWWEMSQHCPGLHISDVSGFLPVLSLLWLRGYQFERVGAGKRMDPKNPIESCFLSPAAEFGKEAQVPESRQR